MSENTAVNDLSPSAVSSRPVSNGILVAGLAAGYVMSIVDTTVINVAGPEIRRRLGVSLPGLTWIVDGYTLTFASLLLLAGSLATRYGAKTVYLRGIALFVFASVLAGLAPNGEVLVGGRLLQGVGAAMCMPSSLALLANTFPDPAQRAKMVGIWASIISGGAAVGPALGGVLVGTVGWRSIFLLNVPVSAFGLLMTSRFIAPIPRRHERIPLAGHVVGVACLAALCASVIEGPAFGWSSAPIVAGFLVAAAAAAAFVALERRALAPVLPRGLLRIPQVNAINGISFLLNFGLFGVIFMFGLFIQTARGADPLSAGLQMLPLWGLFVVGNILFTRITGWAGTRWPMVLGLLVAAVASLVLVSVSADTSYWLLALFVGLSSLSIGVTVPAMTASLVSAAGPPLAGAASSTLNATRQIGTLLGIAVVGVVMRVASGWYLAAAVTFLMAACCYLVASFLGWWFTRAASAAATR